MEGTAAGKESEFGFLEFGIRKYRWTHSDGLISVGSCVWLTFDPDEDLKRSADVLREQRQMAFEIRTSDPIPRGNVYAYLGDVHGRWNPDLAIGLIHKNRRENSYQYYAEGGKKENDDRGRKEEDSDVRRIRTNYWCAARARVGLFFQEDGSERPRPILDKEGNALRTRLKLSYDESYETLYDNVISDFSNLRGDLGSRFERFAEFQKSRERAERSLALELYKRVQDIWPLYRSTLNSILRAPTTQLETTQQHYSLNSSQASKHFSRRRSTSNARKVHSAQNVRGTVLPTQFTTTEPKETLSTDANRYVGFSTHRVWKLISKVRDHLLKEKEMSSMGLKHHEEAFLRIDTQLQELIQKRRQLPHDTRSYTRPVAATHAAELLYDPRYVRLRQLTKRLDHLLGYVDASDLPFEVEALNVLYERWCFVQVVRALKELGFHFVDERGRRTTPFYQNPVRDEVNCHMIHKKCPGKVLEVWYDRKYPTIRRDTDYYDPDRPYGLEKRGMHRSDYQGWKNNPDIVLEFHDCRSDQTRIKGRSPDIITFDPTIASPEKSREKYKYQKGIRSFEERDKYKKSRRIVRAAWGIWPGKQQESEHVTTSEPDYRENGFVHLQPGNGSVDVLPQTVGEILHAVDICIGHQS